MRYILHLTIYSHYTFIFDSPAAGRTVKRSGLRDTGGIYLVSVYRARSGNIHRAVGQDFVMNVDDVLYFTGMVSEFSQFCESHGLEVITNEIDITTAHRTNNIDLTPQDYLVFAQQWKALGATIIGGCCGIGPEHIALLDALKE